MNKTMFAVLALPLATTAETIVVEDFSCRTISNDTATVQSDAIWVDDGASLEKTGKGKWTLPLGLLSSHSSVDIAVRDGALAVPSAAGEKPEPEKPDAVMNLAALWLDATHNLYATNGTGDSMFVKDWRDVRETATGSPYAYAHAVPRWLDPSTDGVSGTYTHPEVKESGAGIKSVYFQGYRSGACLRIVAPDGDASASRYPISKVCHIFAVHGVFETQGFVVSAESGSRLYHPGSTGGLKTDKILTASGNNVPFLANMGVWLDGKKVDPNLTVPKIGYQLLQLDYLCPLADSTVSIDSFYNDFNIRPSKNPGENHIGGDNLCEVLVFTNMLTRTECVAITRHLMAKWGLGAEEARHTLTIAQGAAVELENPADASDEGRISIAESGTVSYPGAGAKAYFGHRNSGFSGSIAIADGQSAVFGDDVYAIASRDGMNLTATNSYEGVLVSAKPDTAGSITVSAYDSEITFKNIPETTKKLTVKTGTLHISPDARPGKLKSGSVSSVEIPNSGFEAAGEDGKGWSSKRDGWTWAGSPNSTKDWCMAWSRKLSYKYGNVTWLSPLFAPEGDYVIAVNYAGSLYSNVSVAEEGEYEISFYIHDSNPSRQKIANKFQQSFQIIVADADGSNERVLGYAIGAYELGYARMRYRTPCLPAGNYRIVFRSPETLTSTDVTATIDDVRMELVSRNDSAIPVPNGDFERVSVPDGELVYSIADSNTAEGWAFEQSDWGSSVEGQPAVAVVRYSMRYSGTDSNSKQGFPFKVQDCRTGMHQLAMLSNCGSARTTFNPPSTGTFHLRAAVCRYRMKVNGQIFYSASPSADPQIEAKLTIGNETFSLGCVTGACQRLTDMEWPVAFELPSAEETVTLTISNRVSNAAAIIDDIVLVPLESAAQNVELVKNGTMTKNAGNWTVDKHIHANMANDSSSAYINSEEAYQFGYTRCHDGEEIPYGMVIVDHAGVYQDVTFPRTGRYRLRYHARGRIDYFEEENKRDVFGYCRDVSARVVLAEGGKTNTISTCYATVSNFLARTVYIDIDEAPKTCTLGFGTTNDYDVTGKKGKSVFIDGVSLSYCGPKAVAPAPHFAEDLAVSVDEGARLVLDFQGCATVGKVRIGGRSYSGIIDAARFPGYISGLGSFKVIPKPTVIVIR